MGHECSLTLAILAVLFSTSSCYRLQDEDAAAAVYRQRRAGEGPGSFLQTDEGLMKRPQRFSFGLGKREPDIIEDLAEEMDLENLHGPQVKREPYAFGLGKREPYAFGLGKRNPYQFGLGKREPYAFGLGKRADYYGFGLGKREPYAFGLGKK